VEDEALGQTWWHSGGQRLLWHRGLRQSPLPVLNARRDRKKVYWSVIDNQPAVRGEDGTDVARLLGWDRALEAIDEIGGAGDLADLEDRHEEAMRLVKQLAREENWDVSSNALLDEVHQAYEARKEALERQEVCFSDAPHRVEPSARRTARLAGEAEAARVHECVRRMRGAKSVDDLLDEASWVRRHKDLFGEEALAHLRKWFCYFRSQLHG
jgi:hypothetical protein